MGDGDIPTNTKPPTYDGKSSWGDFKAQFEIVAPKNLSEQKNPRPREIAGLGDR